MLNWYFEGLNSNFVNDVKVPFIPEYATNNAHMFYLLCPSLSYRTSLIEFLRKHDVQATFHYLPLHSSKYYEDKHDGRILENCDRYSDTLIRLPLYYDLTKDQVDMVVNLVLGFDLNYKTQC